MEELATRAVERLQLSAVFADPTWIVLSGTPGAGKTTLVDWTRSRAVAANHPVLSIRPVEIEESIAFSAISELLTRIPAAEVDRIEPELQHTIRDLAAGKPIDDHDLVRRAVVALLGSFARQSAKHLLFVIDDAQWVDRQSAEVLTFVIRRVFRGHSILVSHRTDTRSLLLDSFVHEPDLERIELAALPDHDLAVIIGHEAPKLTSALCLSLAEFAQGNPLRAREIGRAARRGAESVFKTQNIRVQNNPLVSAAELLTPEHAEVLFAASQLRTADLTTLNRVFAATSVVGAVQAATDAKHAEVIDGRIVFEHPLFADALSAVVPAARQRELHAQITPVITDDIERGRHLSLSTSELTMDQRITVFMASVVASNQGSLALALQLAQRATDGIVPSQSRMYIDSQRFLANLEFRIDDPLAAERRLGALENFLAGDPQQTRIALDLAALIAWSRGLRSDPSRYVDVLSEPGSRPGSDSYDTDSPSDANNGIHADDAEIAEAGMQLAMLDINVRTMADALRHADIGQAAGHRAGGQIKAESTMVWIFANFLSGNGFDEALYQQASHDEDLANWLSVQCPPFSLAPFILTWCEDSRALEAFRVRRSVYRSRGSATALTMGTPFEINLLCSRGLIDDARALVQHGLDAAEFENELTQACSQLAAGRLYAHLGEWQQADNALKSANAFFESFGFRLGAIEVANVRMSMYAAQRNFDAALALGKQWLDNLDEFGMSEPMIVPGMLDLIEIAVTVHSENSDDELLKQLTRRLCAPAVSERSDVQLARKWMSAVSLIALKADAEAARTIAGELVDEWNSSGRVFWVGRAHLLLGRLARREGARRTAADHLEMAIKLFEET